MINFAHSEVFMSGPFTAYFLADALYKSGFLEANPIVGLAMVFALSIAVSTLIAVLLERIAYRPLRGAPRLVPLITKLLLTSQPGPMLTPHPKATPPRR